MSRFILSGGCNFEGFDVDAGVTDVMVGASLSAELGRVMAEEEAEAEAVNDAVVLQSLLTVKARAAREEDTRMSEDKALDILILFVLFVFEMRCSTYNVLLLLLFLFLLLICNTIYLSNVFLHFVLFQSCRYVKEGEQRAASHQHHPSAIISSSSLTHPASQSQPFCFWAPGKNTSNPKTYVRGHLHVK